MPGILVVEDDENLNRENKILRGKNEAHSL